MRATRQGQGKAGMERTGLQLGFQSPLLGRLGQDEANELLALGHVRRFHQDTPIFNKGDPGDCLYLILDGRVGISTVSADGQEIFLNILNVGDVFGEIALLDGKERTAAAVAMAPTRLLRVDRIDFMPFLERHPKLCIRLMTILCERFRWTSDIIEDTIFLDIPHRLAKRLLTLLNEYGTPVDGGTRLNIRLSQEDWARMLGATRESVNKGFRDLQERGAITYDKKCIVVRDAQLLRHFAEGPG